MPPTKDDTCRVAVINEPFCKEASTVVLAFKLADHESDRQTLRMGFKACYKPPVVTFRFNVKVFGYGKKKDKTTVYFDVPRQHISSLEQSDHVDITTVPELYRDNIPKLVGGITRVRFLLKRPGNLIQPIGEQSLKPASQRILASMTLLAEALEFVLFMPHTTLSKEQIQCLKQAVSSPTSSDDQQQQEKEHNWWLKALYGGAGGKLLNTHTTTVSPTAIDSNDISTASESGDSTIATDTPPAYKRSAVPTDHGSIGAETYDLATAADLGDEIATPSPPPYKSLEPTDGDPASAAEMTGKRLRDCEGLNARISRRRLGSESRPADGEQSYSEGILGASKLKRQQDVDTCLPYPVTLFVSKLNEILRRTQHLEEENGVLKAELSIMRKSQHQMNAKVEEMIDRDHKYVKRIQDLENESAALATQINNLRQSHDDMGERQTDLENCQTDFEERQAELLERQTELEEDQAELNVRQEKTEEKCDTIDVEIMDQVHTAVRNRLIGALETM